MTEKIEPKPFESWWCKVKGEPDGPLTRYKVIEITPRSVALCKVDRGSDGLYGPDYDYLYMSRYLRQDVIFADKAEGKND
jgi:hypothetical protein